MITGLHIDNFRGLRHVSLEELRRVNLLVGGNDTGKTSVLEALMLALADGSSISQLPCAFRNNQSDGRSDNGPDDKENFWAWLFYDRNTANQIKIAVDADGQQEVFLESRLVPEGQYQNAPQIPVLFRGPRPIRMAAQQEQELVRFGNNFQVVGHAPMKGFRVSRLSVRPSPPVLDAEKYNQIALEADGEVRFERIMREVEPRIKRLRYAKLPGTNSPLVFADIGLSRAVPSTQMGQAFNRILHIYAEILTSKTNVLLVDEIENGIFSESLQVIWKGLFAVCEEHDVQIFATTHSRECILAANAAAQERRKDELSVQRLQFVKGNIEAVRLGVQHLEVAAEMGLEVRS